MADRPNRNKRTVEDPSRRAALRKLGAGAAAATAAAAGAVTGARAGQDAGTAEGYTAADVFAEFFQDNYRRMTEEEIRETIERLQRKYKAEHGVEITIDSTPPIPGVVYGYALNISTCRGYRDCVHACVRENNQSRDSEIQYIRVLEIDKGTMNLETADHYYEPEQVPQANKFYLPVGCHQCENAPCEKACPVGATWKEPDGIVVVDYGWCIGCRYCAAACPYWARKFNWSDPVVPTDEINPKTHYLSNRPRPRGVMEKCTFCLQRVRKGKMPACQEACPTGARVFGNLLDPHSDIRYVLENKTVFRLKEDLNTEPKFWYYTD